MVLVIRGLSRSLKAIVFDTRLKFIEDYPVPEPGRDEAQVRVRLAGICATDLEIMKGYKEFSGVLGHEFVGVVEKINSGDKRLAGRRVVGEINIGCGSCDFCRQGLKNHCRNRKVLGILNKDGSMAEYLTLPIANLHEVPAHVSDDEAVFTEPLAAAFEIVEQINIDPSHKILVLGDGKLGILVSLVLTLSQADVTLAGKHEHKLRIAGAQGVNTATLSELPMAKDYDIVVDATGSPKGFDMALNLAKPRGTIVLKSTVAERTPMNLSSVVVDEITVIGSRCGPFGPALEALSEEHIDVKPIISGIFPFGRAGEAFEKVRNKNSLKVIIDFGQ
jgi:threonine dehydrogenase-like Zn-dependent dehydrogenase